MSVKRTFQSGHDFVHTFPPDPFCESDRLALERNLSEVVDDWCVELQGICTEEANLVVVPEDGDDAHGPSFVVSREAAGLRVDQVHWDTLTEVGTFSSMSQVTAVLRARLAFCSAGNAPASVTVH